MFVKLKHSDAATLEWLRSYGHPGKYAVRLIERQKKIISDIMTAPTSVEMSKAFQVAQAHLDNWDKEPE